MSEANKNKNKDKGRQRNALKYDTEPKREHGDAEISKETEFLNLNGKRNKRYR